MDSNFARLPDRNRHHQRGAALFVTLMMLLIITILGIASMRLGLTQSVISRNSAADNIAFQSAEAALNAVMQEATTCDNHNTCESTDNVIGGAGAGAPTVRCMTTTGVITVASADLCGYTDLTGPHNYLDKRGTVRAVAVTTSAGQVPIDGNDPNAINGANFKTEATAEIPSLGVIAVHVQEFSKVAPARSGLD